MADDDVLVRVTLRGRALEAGARLLAVAGELPLFLALERPLPVGTILGISACADGDAGDGDPWAFEVRRVIEPLWRGPEGLRGCLGRRIAVDLGAWGRRVGSEHLADGSAARRLRLCPAPTDAGHGDAEAPAGASVIVLHEVIDRTPRASGGGKRRRGRARG